MSSHGPENRYGWEESAQAWIETVDADANRSHLLDPIMLTLCETTGKTALDIGCGQGRFCRMLTERGASAIGIDPIRAMIEEASRLGGTYLVADAQALPFQAEAFDVTVSYLALIDIPDFDSAIREMARVTARGGFLVIATVHPMTTSIPYWHKDSDGNRIYWRVDRYFEERCERVSWSGIDVSNWHRPMERYMGSLIGSGLILDTFIEPKPTARQVDERPSLADQVRVPNFVVMRWRKP